MLIYVFFTAMIVLKYRGILSLDCMGDSVFFCYFCIDRTYKEEMILNFCHVHVAAFTYMVGSVKVI